MADSGFVVVQSLSCVWLFATPWTAARQASLSIPIRVSSNSYPSSQWCHPTISFPVVPFSSCPQFFPEVFSSESALCIRWPKYWNFSISPYNEYLGLISFKLTGLLVQSKGLWSLLQHHSSNTSILRHSVFFMVHTWLLEKP